MSKCTIEENIGGFNVTLACVAQSASYNLNSVNTLSNDQTIFKSSWIISTRACMNSVLFLIRPVIRAVLTFSVQFRTQNSIHIPPASCNGFLFMES